MRINKNTINFFIVLTYVISCFPLLTFGMRSVITIVWSLFGLFIFSKKRTRLNKDIWIFILPYLLLLCSLIYSDNIQTGIDSLIKMLSFILFPLIFYLNKDFFSKKQISNIIYLFVLSVFILIIYQIANVIFNYSFLFDNITLQEIKSNGFSALSEINDQKINQIKLRRFRNFIIEISNTHTTYQGLWISFSVFFLISEFKKIQKSTLKIVCLFSIIVLICWLYFISARMPIMALLISGSVTIFFFSNYSKLKLVKIGLVFSTVIIASLCFKNPFSIRVKEYYNTGLGLLEKTSKTSEFNSSNVRNGIYYCDLKLIKESPFIGVGIGDLQAELNKCYNKEIGAKVYTWRDYNTHNQYAFFWISSGFLGLSLFLLLIFNLFKKSIKNEDYLLFYLSILTVIIFFTENLLERSDGVLFFGFFTGLFYFNTVRK
ncbi:MAG: O-antigen ligase family protein [Polaribacter sp.]|nr:O-antigen ligase family protein [Polaribacter sp.]